jgi:ribonuclease Z
MLAVAGPTTVVADCGADVIQRYLAAGLEIDRLEALILTHEHPDHISGFPLFMEKIWLAGRRRPIPVCGPKPTLDRARALFEIFDTSGWEGLPEIEWRAVPLEAGAVAWSSDDWRVTAAPGKHGVPVIGLRFEASGGGTVVYSSDTEPVDSILHLSRGADILVHEATGGFEGHTSASAAAELAAGAGVRQLILVHVPPHLGEAELRSAEAAFPGVEIGRDGDALPF